MLPKNLKYGSKVEASPARSFRSNIAPQNGTGNYNLSDQIIINIPTRANLVLCPSESYLKFNLKVTGAGNDNVIRFDSCGAHGLIQRIRIYHGSNLLEDIDNYGMLAKILYDLQQPTDATYGKLNVISGTRSDLVVKNATAYADAAAITAAINNGTISATQVNSGEYLATLADGGDVTRTYCINLISLVGSLCSQHYLPLFACTSAPLRVELTLVNALNQALCTRSGGTIQISNCEYVGQFIELSDVAMGMISQSLQGQPLQFVVPEYRNYVSSQFTLQNAAQEVQIPIAAKFNSLKSLIMSVRDKGTGANTFMPFSSTTLNLSQYYFRIGANVVPAKAPATYQEMFSECLKALGSMSDLNYQPSIDKTSYTQTTSAAVVFANDSTYNAVSSGSFYIGIDLENYSAASKDTIFAGLNTTTDDVYAVLNYAGVAGAPVPRYDIYANFDCLLVFENGTAYIKA